MSTNLIYQNKKSINSIIDEPSGCMKALYNTLLPDLLKECFGEQMIIQLMNEALCISTRILIDPNPELHLNEYFEQKKEEDLLFGVEYKRFLKVMVYRIIARRHDYGTGRFQTFLNLLEGKIWWHYSMNVAALRIDTDFYYAQRVYLPIDFSRLRDFVEKLCANENKPDEQQSIRIYHQLTDNNLFYFRQMLSLLSAHKQHRLIQRLYQIFTTKGGATRPLPHQDKLYEQFVKQVSIYRNELVTEGIDDDEPFVPPYFPQDMPLSLDGRRLSDSDAPAQPYNPDKAMQLWKQLYGDFLRNEWPKEVANVRRKLNRLPIEKHGIAMKQIMDKWEGQLYCSNFMMYYEEGALDETFSAPDTGFHNEAIEYDSHLSDLYDDEIGILNEEKIAQYVWCNAWRLTMKQLHAFLMHHQGRLNFEPTGEIVDMAQQTATASCPDEPPTEKTAEQYAAVADNPIATTTAASSAVVTATPKASAYIHPQLANNKQAWSTFVELMQSFNSRINKKTCPRDQRWRWPHIKAALEDMGFIDKNLGKSAFAKTIELLALEGRKQNSVQQSFKSDRNIDFPNFADKNIIDEIKERLNPVKDLM